MRAYCIMLSSWELALLNALSILRVFGRAFTGAPAGVGKDAMRLAGRHRTSRLGLKWPGYRRGRTSPLTDPRLHRHLQDTEVPDLARVSGSMRCPTGRQAQHASASRCTSPAARAACRLVRV